MKACASEQNIKLALMFYSERSQVSITRSVVKDESCEQASVWKFTYTQSERKQVQAHAVRLKVKSENGKLKAESCFHLSDFTFHL